MYIYIDISNCKVNPPFISFAFDVADALFSGCVPGVYELP